MGKVYSVRSDSDAQATASDNTVTAGPTPPHGAVAMEISVVTTDVWIAWAGATPASTLGAVYKKDQPPVLKTFAAPFKFKATSNAATVVNVTWLFD